MVRYCDNFWLTATNHYSSQQSELVLISDIAVVAAHAMPVRVKSIKAWSDSILDNSECHLSILRRKIFSHVYVESVMSGDSTGRITKL
jgi:hypothetical protein